MKKLINYLLITSLLIVSIHCKNDGVDDCGGYTVKLVHLDETEQELVQYLAPEKPLGKKAAQALLESYEGKVYKSEVVTWCEYQDYTDENEHE